MGTSCIPVEERKDDFAVTHMPWFAQVLLSGGQENAEKLLENAVESYLHGRPGLGLFG